MPRLDIDMFDDAPHVGDKVKVMGKVKSIDEDSGEVEVTYDDVSIVEKRKKKRNRHNEDMMDEEVVADTQQEPNSQSLDYALGQAFPPTQ